jgi:hypothetical protein
MKSSSDKDTNYFQYVTIQRISGFAITLNIMKADDDDNDDDDDDDNNNDDIILVIHLLLRTAND